ncbi:restriction endonuclease subunit S [Acidovorax temperans]|uniref:restriction endonuclease subunit S n=1 Tax=Acidovorax temperans TaxID=80878 RepID=UPI00391A56E7
MLLSNMELLATAPGGVAKLRELILTLAVQGKLVPQDPADEPASVLLQKIRAEKDRLMAEGKIKRDKPLAEIGEEEKPFELPAGWEWVRLGSTMEMLNGRAFKPSEWMDAGLPIVRIQNLNNPNASFNYCDPSTVVDKNRIDDGAFLISWSGTPGTSFGAFIWSRGAAALNQHIFKCVLIGRVFLPEFLRLSINSQLNVLIAQAQGGVGLQHVTKGVLENLVLVLPPLAEQSRIVTRVEALMRLCDALEAKGQLEAAQHAQLVSTLLGTLTASTTPEELAAHWQRVAQHFDLLLDRPEAIDALEQTLLQLAVRGLLVPQDPTDEPASALLQKIRAEKDRLIATGQIKQGKPLPPITDEEKPFELPVGWEWVRWANVAMKIGDIDHKMPSEAKDGVPYVSPRDFYGTNEIDFDGAKKIAYSDYVELASKIRPEAGDLIYPRYGTIGVVRKVTTDREFLASYSCAVIKVLPGFIEPDYQYLFSVSGCAKAQAASATNKTTQPNVGLKSIQEFLVPLPPLAEQSRIVTRITALRRLCVDLRQRLAERQSVQARLAEALVQEVA